MRVGVDTGGTFTDVVAADGRVAKLASTPDDPARAVAEGVAAVGGADVLAHGTTVATNALLERRGATVALVTNRGFADLIEIGRQDRPSLYDATARRPVPLVPRELRLEVDGRIGPDGVELDALGAVPDVPEGVAAVAVCLLHGDLDPRHEVGVAAQLAERGLAVTSSHEVSPQMREYERLSTTVVTAYLRPLCEQYLQRLVPLADDVLVLTSAGGLVPVAEASAAAARLLLSGPAGGVLAGAHAAVAAGFPDAVTFDMGGTSTDVCLVQDGRAAPAGERTVAGLPIRLPSLDVHTIGAGGGSIASVDPGGALTVGPRSAGAAPGPACYGRGGTEPTVTDADLVAGRIPTGAAFGDLALDASAAAAALNAAGVDAGGVIAVVDAAMVQAVRRVSVERGVDPTGLALVAFGGAGPLHACAIAEALGMPAVVVPPRAGVLSAAGILAAHRQADLVRSWPTPGSTDGLRDAVPQLVLDVARAVGVSGDFDIALWQGALVDAPVTMTVQQAEIELAVDCRYVGQAWELTVPCVADFHAEHERRNGYARGGVPVEVVALRARVERHGPVDGPATIAEADCTIWVAEGWRADVAESGAWVLRPSEPTAVPFRCASSLLQQGGSTPERGSELDAAGLAVLIGRLTGVAEEMQAVLRRAASSPNIKERADCSCALFTAAGELLVQSDSIPVHLGSMPASVAAAIAAFGADGIAAGQQIVLNDPFAGGTHLNDITIVAPCHLDGRLVGWVANRAHHADVGGMVPGSIPPDATEIAQEGLRIPPSLLTDGIVGLVLANSRTPEERRGDLDAQAGANAVGVAGLAEVMASGADVDQVVAYGERRMRAALAALPDGRWTFVDVLHPPGAGAIDVAVELTIDGDEATFDLSASGPQVRGNVNAVRAVTESAVAYAIRVATDPTIPANGGALRPVHVVTRPGTVVDAQPPAAVGAGNVEVSQRVADACLGALAAAAPDRVPAAGQGTMNNVILGSSAAGFVLYETLAGGQGGGPHSAGDSGIQTGMTNTRNTPIEAMERAFPLRVRRYTIRRGSGGAGKHAGGEGLEKEVEVLVPCTLSLITERRSSAPWGLHGGEPGAVGEQWLLRGGHEATGERLPAVCTVELEAGDVVRIWTPGGGGWGRAR
jgi:5-oxoprolinase (ATP-hydrolysing)